jgi:hypothetical protein
MAGSCEYGDEPSVPHNEDNFLTSHRTISCSGQTMLRGFNLVHLVTTKCTKNKISMHALTNFTSYSLTEVTELHSTFILYSTCCFHAYLITLLSSLNYLMGNCTDCLKQCLEKLIMANFMPIIQNKMTSTGA